VHLCSVSYEGRDRLCARLDDDWLIDVSAAVPDAFRSPSVSLPAPPDVMSVVAAGSSVLAAIREKLAAAPPSACIAAAAVRWHPPLRRPGKIIGVAVNNSASNPRKISAPDHPLFFLKPATCLIGHGDEIVMQEYYGGAHPEPELAVIVGRQLRHAGPEEALAAVFGYSIFNDITGNAMRAADSLHYYALYARPDAPDETERREQHLSYAARYKGTDTFGPFGPFVVTADAVPDPHALDVVCSVDGDVVAEDSTAYYNYSVGEVLSFISWFHTLEPGDVVSMGTAFREKPGARRSLHTADFQRLGSRCSITISGLGTLSNPIRRVAGALGRWRLPHDAA
jgi:2-keto-4-pentenoate hydratase/2-oxohepta-3-ene-1,7-dioic acid hydratase in catechol pathway